MKISQSQQSVTAAHLDELHHKRADHTKIHSGYRVVVCPFCCLLLLFVAVIFWLYRCSGCCSLLLWLFVVLHHSLVLKLVYFFSLFSALFQQLGVKFSASFTVWHGAKLPLSIQFRASPFALFPPNYFFFAVSRGTLLLFLVWHHRCVLLLLLLYPRDLSKPDLQ